MMIFIEGSDTFCIFYLSGSSSEEVAALNADKDNIIVIGQDERVTLY